MGTLNFLVSDKSKEYCDLGKIHLDDSIVEKIRNVVPDEVADKLAGWLLDSVGDLNNEISKAEARFIAEKVDVWIESHPDWRFLSEYDDAFDEIYLAENLADAEDYLDEFGAESRPIYYRSETIVKYE